MPIKRLLDPHRMRKAPPHGFAWIDHRLLREGYIGRASPPALALYLLLVCAADAQGLSYYYDPRAAELLGLASADISTARRELIALGLIAYHKPLYQLLSLDPQPTLPPAKAPPPSQHTSALRAGAPQCGFSLRTAVEELLHKGGPR